MYQKLLIATLLIISFLPAGAQSPMKIGKTQLNAGVGLSSWGIPIYVGLDYQLTNDITVGGEATFRRYGEKFLGTKYNHSIMGILGNGNYHFNRVLGLPKNFDFYAGLNIGFFVWNSPNGYPGNRSSGLNLGGQIGGRYYFNNSIGINLEAGGGNAFGGGKLGVSIRL